MSTPQSSLNNLPWYARYPRANVMPALITAIYYSIMWTMTAIFSSPRYPIWTIIYSLLFILISLGLYKMRREAAIAGLIMFFIDLLLNYLKRGITGTISDASIIFVFIFAIMGTFAKAKLSQNKEH